MCSRCSWKFPLGGQPFADDGVFGPAFLVAVAHAIGRYEGIPGSLEALDLGLEAGVLLVQFAETLPQLNALNTAGKSQADAAKALEVSVGAVRTWIALTGISWSNLNKRGPYAKRTK